MGYSATTGEKYPKENSFGDSAIKPGGRNHANIFLGKMQKKVKKNTSKIKANTYVESP